MLLVRKSRLFRNKGVLRTSTRRSWRVRLTPTLEGCDPDHYTNATIVMWM
jgi:hypothetical protein